jgi:hypothetical protein
MPPIPKMNTQEEMIEYLRASAPPPLSDAAIQYQLRRERVWCEAANTALATEGRLHVASKADDMLVEFDRRFGPAVEVARTVTPGTLLDLPAEPAGAPSTTRTNAATRRRPATGPAR